MVGFDNMHCSMGANVTKLPKTLVDCSCTGLQARASHNPLAPPDPNLNQTAVKIDAGEVLPPTEGDHQQFWPDGN